MKKLIILSIATLLLSSCGKSYMVRDFANNDIIYMDNNDLGNDYKVGDTVRMTGTQRVPLTSERDTILGTQFTGVVVSVDKR